MHCRNCNYRLWNIASRTCPECGTPFRPSDFEFVPNSVQFCCPHCRQAYYGTDPRGHLVPAAFDCVKCGAAIVMDEMLLLPASGVEEESTQPPNMPWLERREIGRKKAWFATVKLALLHPGKLIEAVPEDYPTGSAIWFASITNFIVSLLSIGVIMALPMFVAMGAAGRGGRAMVGVFVVFCFTAGAALASIAWMAIWALMAHGLLRISGRTHAGQTRTGHAIYFSSGANAVTAVPCLGLYIGWIAQVVSAVLMVRQAQRVSGLRAAFAVATPPVVAMVGIGTLYMFFLLRLMSTIAYTTTAPYPGVGPIPVASAIIDFARSHGDRGPRHVAELLWSGGLLPNDLVSPGRDAMADRIVVGTRTIADLVSMPQERREKIIEQFVKERPGEEKVYRFGDFVFAHADVDFAKRDVPVWIVIEWPLNAAPQLVRIGLSDGTSMILSRDALAQVLAEQNSVRAKRRLAPIPDPETMATTE